MPTPHSAAPAPSPRPLPRLSNELIAHIVDSLADDPAALAACALAARAFLPPARTNRFRSVRLHLQNAPRFLALLERTPALGPCVRALHLTVSTLEQRSNWVDRLLPALAPRLPRVDELCMRGKGLYRAPPLLALQSVRTLRVCGCEIESLDDFCALLGGFPRLQAVITDEMFVYRCPEVTRTPSAPSKSLRRMEFNSARIDPVMLVDWVVQERIGENFEYLACCPIQRVAIEPLDKLLAAAGSSLKRLKISLVGLVAQGGFVEILERYTPLVHSTGLRHLEFCSPAAYANMYGADDASFAWFPTLLAQIRAPLAVVSFYLWEGDAEGLHGAVWNDVVLLLSLKFGSLERVEVHVWGDPAKTAGMRKRARELFWEYEERGMLYVDDVPDPACS